ncbi:ATP-dependent RNA helicase [Pseudonocardia oroxyli]|uniref:ATP-dependent helicase HrpB n=1 Tax=Pseudonocardia oroxyli TaxID=366584 RepID=A0A1G7DXM0_PSEOR|nr:ATP-dependent helicase C-terminal domain-containing protein [Pseudonocardia oroxyli]SDE56092.1 ATP-dependent helicase HrpB [Pseudonocardia oroxyli]
MLAERLPDLPVRGVLSTVTHTLTTAGAAVLVAPPGTGKTTLVPLALADAVEGTVLVAEPRRVAARAAAARMASLVGERVGERIGYAVRGDARPGSRVEVVTAGLLLRRLIADPDLPGVGAVMLDECHERHLDADLLLSLLLDARAGLRPDLPVLAASATVAAERLAELLGGAPVVEVEARTHPVEVRYAPPQRGERIEACVARGMRGVLGAGSVLAFLPGVPEIRRTAAALGGVGVPVLPLHGRLSAAEQDAALRDSGPRVVLATAVAESSLTVPGVRAVVDAGLARVPRVDHRRGMSGLVTVPVSGAVADQRAGRAGREAPGTVVRCWPEGQRLAPYPEPEIRTADLTRLALDLAVWGTPDGAALSWWDAPPPGPLTAAREVLRALGAVAADGAITPRGRRLATLGLHPRLARALLDGADALGARTAAEIVAVLDDDTLTQGADLTAELGRLRAGAHPATHRWRAEVGRLAGLVGRGAAGARDDLRSARVGADGARAGHAPAGSASAGRASTSSGSAGRASMSSASAGRAAGRAAGSAEVRGPGRGAGAATALVVGLAQPERVARRRAGAAPVFLLAGGTAVEVVGDPALGAQEWLAVAVADRVPGAVHGRVRLAAAADRETAERAAAALLTETDEVTWTDGDVRAVRLRRLGAIVLDESPLRDPDPELVRAALRAGLHAEGPELLRWSRADRALRERLDFLHRAVGDPWPDVSDDALVAAAEDPAGPLAGALASARRRADLAAVDAGDALRALVGWPLAGRIDELAPPRLTVPTGSAIAVDYSGERPTLPVRVQEMFGATASPRIGGVPVLLHLLSPAGRPAAVTDDLESFWDTGYPQVRAELRGRYPKHHWPEDPRAATPTRRTGRNRP